MGLHPSRSGSGAAARARRCCAPLAAASLAAIGSAAGAAGDRTFGEHLAAECVTCHQPSGSFAGIPAIVGWPDETFVAAMNQYKVKARANPVMQTIARRLSDDEIAALAAYFGSLTPQPWAP